MKSTCRRQEERTQVDVQIEVEAQLQEQSALEHPGRHVGRADGAEEDRVVVAQLGDGRVGQHLARLQVAGAAQVVLVRLERHAGRASDLDRLGDDIGADAVSADHGDAM